MGRNEGGELRVSKERQEAIQRVTVVRWMGSRPLTAFVPSTGMSGAIWVTSCAMTCPPPRKLLKVKTHHIQQEKITKSSTLASYTMKTHIEV